MSKLLIHHAFLLIFFFASQQVLANNLKLSDPLLYLNKDSAYAILNVEWDNAWKNDRNHDAIWLFFKFMNKEGDYTHIKILPNGHETAFLNVNQDVKLDYQTSDDGMGLFISPKKKYRGRISATIKVDLVKKSFENVNTRSSSFQAFAIEMVFIPKEGFTLGDPDRRSLEFGSLFVPESDDYRDLLTLLTLHYENTEIEIGSDLDLFYLAPEGYEGDQRGTIPVDFPKGVNSFYSMKYELSQGEYADFLNTLSENQSQNRVNFGGKGYYNNRGSIYLKGSRYIALNPNAPCNYLSWDDAMAYADWAGLRPMTEFEFEKACRGGNQAEPLQFPWGKGKERIQRMVSTNGTLEMLNGWDESKLSNQTLDIFGASYYWVMDLAGSLWERVITIGDSTGRSFSGSNGDGKLSGYGFATNSDWPSGIEDTSGYGFRGGGFYGYGRDYHEFNPYSPIGFRSYAAWSGGNRSKAYGSRFVRSYE